MFGSHSLHGLHGLHDNERIGISFSCISDFKVYMVHLYLSGRILKQSTLLTSQNLFPTQLHPIRTNIQTENDKTIIKDSHKTEV